MNAFDKIFGGSEKMNDDIGFEEDEYYQNYDEDNYYNDKNSSRRDKYMKKDNYNDLDDYNDFDEYGYDMRDRQKSKRRDYSSRSVTRSDRPDRNDRNDRNNRMDRNDRADRMDRSSRMDRNDRDDRMDRSVKNDYKDRSDRYERDERVMRDEDQERYEYNYKASDAERSNSQNRGYRDKASTQTRPSSDKKNLFDGMGVCVMRPTSIEDSRDIVDTLGGRTVVLNLEGLDIEVAQRIIDFSSGACYAINGNLQKISQFIFLLTPANVDISGDLNSFLGQNVPGINN